MTRARGKRVDEALNQFIKEIQAQEDSNIKEFKSKVVTSLMAQVESVNPKF